MFLESLLSIKHDFKLLCVSKINVSEKLCFELVDCRQNFYRLLISLYAIFKVQSFDSFQNQMEITRFELVTSCLQGRRSPN